MNEKEIVDIEDDIPLDKLKPNVRVALRSETDSIFKIMPSTVSNYQCSRLDD